MLRCWLNKIFIIMASAQLLLHGQEPVNNEPPSIAPEILQMISDRGGFVYRSGGIRDLYCGMPLRFFPTKGNGAGDYMGLYFPRGKNDPWIAEHLHEDGRLSITSVEAKSSRGNRNVDADIRALPHLITLDHYRGNVEYSPNIPHVPLGLIIRNMESGLWDAEKDEPGVSEEKLLEWFLPHLQKHPVFAAHFTDPEQVMQWRPWVAVAEEFAKQGQIVPALNCYDAAIQTTNCFPNYGEPTRAKPRWSRLLGILKMMEPVIEKSDAIDRRTFTVILKSAEDFTASTEKND